MAQPNAKSCFQTAKRDIGTCKCHCIIAKSIHQLPNQSPPIKGKDVDPAKFKGGVEGMIDHSRKDSDMILEKRSTIQVWQSNVHHDDRFTAVFPLELQRTRFNEACALAAERRHDLRPEILY